MTLERNKRIVELREQGRTFNDISIQVGVSVGHVNNLYYAHCPRPGEELVPKDMSIITARDVAESLGLWPSGETAETIRKRMMELSRKSQKRKTMPEVTHWLQGLGIGRSGLG